MDTFRFALSKYHYSDCNMGNEQKREKTVWRAMTQVVDDNGFERNRNESRNILKVRFKEYSIGIVLGNKGEKNKRKFPSLLVQGLHGGDIHHNGTLEEDQQWE